MDYEGASTPMGPSGSHLELIYLVGMDCDDRIGSRFTFVHKGVLVFMRGGTKVSEQSLWIGLID